MTYEAALHEAIGYAWGREDASSEGTSESTHYSTLSGAFAFAKTFAEGWQQFNQEERTHMTNLRSAYNTWQKTQGDTIFSD